VIRLLLNGRERETAAADIAAILEELDLHQTRVAVERNGEIVPRDRYSATALADGDRLEVVQFVGGG